MTRLCPQCGTANRDDARHCMGCGAVLAASEMPNLLCPAGRHVMDPGWSECPYCSGANAEPEEETAPRGSGRRKTVSEDEAPAVKEKNLPPMPSPPAGAGQKRRRTEFDPDQAADAGPARGDVAPQALPASRRIVGILVTYTWRPDGQVFPVRMGRNYIGSDPDCEISLRDDPHLSGRHATIIYRGATFVIDDEKSMNGTFVNGQTVDMKTRLPNYARIKTGSTVWTFIAIEPEAKE